MQKTRVGLIGINGRMNLSLRQCLAQSENMELTGAVVRDLSSVSSQKESGETYGFSTFSSLHFVNNIRDLVSEIDVLIDFSLPEATQACLDVLLTEKICLPYVCGVTGFSETQEAQIRKAADFLPMLRASNFSIGANILFQLTQYTAELLDIEWDIEILEMHHRGKRDAPSGTALAIGKAASQGRENLRTKKQQKEETGSVQKEEAESQQNSQSDFRNRSVQRQSGDIGYAVLRGGNVVGDHEVLFASKEEILSIRHRALDRSLFAQGALKGAHWLAAHQQNQPGLYNMQDVIGKFLPS